MEEEKYGCTVCIEKGNLLIKCTFTWKISIEESTMNLCAFTHPQYSKYEAKIHYRRANGVVIFDPKGLMDKIARGKITYVKIDIGQIVLKINCDFQVRLINQDYIQYLNLSSEEKEADQQIIQLERQLNELKMKKQNLRVMINDKLDLIKYSQIKESIHEITQTSEFNSLMNSVHVNSKLQKLSLRRGAQKERFQLRSLLNLSSNLELFQNFKEISLTGMNIQDDGFEIFLINLPLITKIKRINFSENNLTGKSISRLTQVENCQKFTNLEQLVIGDNNITEIPQQKKEIGILHNLHVFELNFCSISETGLETVLITRQTFKNAKRIDLKQNQHATEMVIFKWVINQKSKNAQKKQKEMVLSRGNFSPEFLEFAQKLNPSVKLIIEFVESKRIQKGEYVYYFLNEKEQMELEDLEEKEKQRQNGIEIIEIE